MMAFSGVHGLEFLQPFDFFRDVCGVSYRGRGETVEDAILVAEMSRLSDPDPGLFHTPGGDDGIVAWGGKIQDMMDWIEIWSWGSWWKSSQLHCCCFLRRVRKLKPKEVWFFCAESSHGENECFSKPEVYRLPESFLSNVMSSRWVEMAMVVCCTFSPSPTAAAPYSPAKSRYPVQWPHQRFGQFQKLKAAKEKNTIKSLCFLLLTREIQALSYQ